VLIDLLLFRALHGGGWYLGGKYNPADGTTMGELARFQARCPKFPPDFLA